MEWLSEHSVCYLLGKVNFLEQEECSERKLYEVRLERTAIKNPFFRAPDYSRITSPYVGSARIMHV